MLTISAQDQASYDVTIDAPDSIGYYETKTINVSLTKTSYSDPQNVQVDLRHALYTQSWEVETLSEDTVLQLRVRGDQLTSGSNAFTAVTNSGQQVTAKGKLGQLSMRVHEEISVALEDGRVVVQPRTQSRKARQLWATSRTLVNNLVVGVSTGFNQNLEINGVGYRAAVQGSDLVLNLGFSHEVRYPIPDGITMKCEKPTSISISGADKQRVGQIAAEIRAWRPPEPYKGKGVRYAAETILRKEGKKK